MSRERIVTLLLIGFGILGIVYYLGRKPRVATPGAGGPNTQAGGAAISRTVRSASAGVSGSIPNIIASAAALTGQSFGSVAARQVQQSGGAPKVGAIEATMYDPGNELVEPTNVVGFSGSQLVGLESSGTVNLPNFGDFAPDVAGNVSALDAGGLDLGTIYA